MFSDFAKMFTEWVFYVMLVILVASAVLQIRFLQAALQSFDSTVPIILRAVVCSDAFPLGIFFLGGHPRPVCVLHHWRDRVFRRAVRRL